MCNSNLIVLTPDENYNFTAERSTCTGNIGAYTYTRDQLITMSSKLRNSKYCTLPFDTIRNIRELKLNECPTRKHNNRYLLKPKTANTKDLIQISLTEKNNLNNIRIATINVRSIKNKPKQIVETSNLENTDFIILTETWLKDTDEDKAWIDSSDLH